SIMARRWIAYLGDADGAISDVVSQHMGYGRLRGHQVAEGPARRDLDAQVRCKVTQEDIGQVHLAVQPCRQGRGALETWIDLRQEDLVPSQQRIDPKGPEISLACEPSADLGDH